MITQWTEKMITKLLYLMKKMVNDGGREIISKLL